MIQVATDKVIRVPTFSSIHASPPDVRALIRPPETALFLEPTEAIPSGAGHVGRFGRFRGDVGLCYAPQQQEEVQLIEVVKKIPQRLAVIRQIAQNDPATRATFRLTPNARGTTFEYENALTVRGIHE